MKICHIMSLYPPLIFGGVEIYVKRIAEKMAELGIDIVVITMDSNIQRIRWCHGNVYIQLGV